MRIKLFILYKKISVYLANETDYMVNCSDISNVAFYAHVVTTKMKKLVTLS